MTKWTADELEKIETADELEIASLRSDGTLGSTKEDDLGGEDRRRPLRPVGERSHIRLVPRHPATPPGPDPSGQR